MPSPFTSSFASAAAGNSNSDSNSHNRNSVRGEGSGSGDWSRARTNGATQTFRRPSLATTLSQSSHQRENSQNHTLNSTTISNAYVPPHLSSNHQSNASRPGNPTELRYPKDQLLNLYRTQKDAGELSRGVSNLYVNGWEPKNTDGTSGGSWGKKDEQTKDNAPGPEICWEHDGTVQPLGLLGMTDEEKEWFKTSVNSPLKAPQTTNKESTPSSGVAGRKTSISQMQNASSAYGVSSPTTSRPGNRRWETSDSIGQYNNPSDSPATNSKLFKDESSAPTPPPSLLKRRTDLKEPNVGPNIEERDNQEAIRDHPTDTSSPFGTLKRNSTAPFSAGLNGLSSPWSAAPPSAGYSPMGAFGSFALGGDGSQPSTLRDKKPLHGSLRGESRFKGLMGGDSTEDMSSRIKEKSSIGSLEKLSEVEPERIPQRWGEARAARPLSGETDPYVDMEGPTGSAALGGGQDFSPPRHHAPGFGTPTRDISRDEMGFSAFGMSSDLPGFRDLVQHQRRDLPQHQTPQGQQHTIPGSQEPMSPTDTNPYQSPEGEKADSEDVDTDSSDMQNTHLPGTSGFSVDQGMSTFGSYPRGASAALEGTAGDRSQTSSAGPSRAFPTLNGLGGLGGLGGHSVWPSAPGLGTPSRDRVGFQGFFGDSIFSPMSDLQSPSLGGLGSGGIFGSNNGPGVGGTGTVARGSKMGSLFPKDMQEQMRGMDHGRQEDMPADRGERQGNIPHIMGRNAFGNIAPGSGAPGRDTDSPMRTGRSIFDEITGPNNGSRGMRSSDASFQEPSMNAFSEAQTILPLQRPQPTTSNTAGMDQFAPGPQRNASQADLLQDTHPGNPLDNQLPLSQQRTMVMPDRMRWEYKDPANKRQGPYSGLEMHDWYKNGYFSAELLVKKQEEPNYEPLAQMIRRIGNSREPFLVPQKGIPHDAPSSQNNSQWTAAGVPPSSTASTIPAGSAQPPFASSFPSFGTTLTAEQQNALERRKQEEQFLMARQKEHLAQQQIMIKQMHQMQGGQHGMHPQQLHHHSSAHSLQSQPSFGSITSPSAYQPSPTQGPTQASQGFPGFSDASLRQSGGTTINPFGSANNLPGGLRDDEISALLERLQQPDNPLQAQQVAAMMSDRARLQREQAQYDAIQQAASNEQQISDDRLQQFHNLRAQIDEEQAFAPRESMIGTPSAAKINFGERAQQQQQQQYRSNFSTDEFAARAQLPPPATNQAQKEPEVLSLTEQVQKAASAKQSPALQPQSPWAKVETGLPQPFPPPQSSSPLPAPAAQRNRQHVAEALTAESRSRSQTPSVDTPSTSIAPWAKENLEGLKGPSLREIQQAESRTAAQQEEIAAAARKTRLEQERISQPAVPAPAPGLPSSSTWGSGGSPVIPSSSTPSAWGKPVVSKPSVPQSSAGTKKTLQQIQKEEELRKQKVIAAAAGSMTSPAGTGSLGVATGKRYADLASKTAAPQGPSSAWTTVGVTGKSKHPAGTGIVGGPTPGIRVASAGVVPSIGAPGKPKPVATPSRTTNLGGPLPGQPNANDEFAKWAKGALSKGLNPEIKVDEFVQQLLAFPAEPEIISEAVYASSPTLDGRRFAEEYVRRRRLADRGILDPSSASSNGYSPSGIAENKVSGGWNEVAKKGPVNGAKDETNSTFKVVAAKKKGKGRL
ncbi:MAG: hypothetical protein M1827_001856 [Pycnora praestabilis]|nr:MAG: hypothetical protein M1827_001856 [Pycnora praestabilis]